MSKEVGQLRGNFAYLNMGTKTKLACHLYCGSGIRCLFDPWIRDPGWVRSQDPDPV